MTAPMMPSPDELLMGLGGRAVSFPNIGDAVRGTLLGAPRVAQQTDIKDNSPKFFPSGSPMLQLLITLQTDLRDGEDDDGVRTLYAKANMLKAIRDAVVAAGAKGLAAGGELAVQYTGDGEAAQKGFNKPKMYAAAYRPPAVAVDTLLGVASPQPERPAAAPLLPPPAPAAAAGPPPLLPTPAMAAASGNGGGLSCPAGFDPAVWKNLAPAQQEVLARAVQSAEPPF